MSTRPSHGIASHFFRFIIAGISGIEEMILSATICYPENPLILSILIQTIYTPWSKFKSASSLRRGQF